MIGLFRFRLLESISAHGLSFPSFVRPLTGASKALAEKAAWDYMKDEKPGFSLCSLAPALIIGPPHQNIHSLEALNTSLSDIRAMMSSETGTIPKTEFPVGIDGE